MVAPFRLLVVRQHLLLLRLVVGRRRRKLCRHGVRVSKGTGGAQQEEEASARVGIRSLVGVVAALLMGSHSHSDHRPSQPTSFRRCRSSLAQTICAQRVTPTASLALRVCELRWRNAMFGCFCGCRYHSTRDARRVVPPHRWPHPSISDNRARTGRRPLTQPFVAAVRLLTANHA